jgi:drug/metabolite transporter (DMT)-like permease
MNKHYALLTAILWGACYSSTEQVVKHIDSRIYLLFSCLLSAILFFIWIVYDGTINEAFDVSRLRSSWPFILFSSFASFFACFFSLQAVKSSGAANAAIVEISYPLWTAFFLFLLFGKNCFTPSFLIGGFFITIGTLIVSRSHGN